MRIIKEFKNKSYGLFLSTCDWKDIICVMKTGKVLIGEGGIVNPNDIDNFEIKDFKIYFNYLKYHQYISNISKKQIEKARLWVDKANKIIEKHKG